MDVVSAEILLELDPKKKTPEWANQAIQNIREDWSPYVNRGKLVENKKYLYALDDMEKVKSKFKDKHFLKTTDFQSLGSLDQILNTLTEELVKDPPKAELRATDPAAISDLENDLGKLKNRKIIEGDLTRLNQQIGLPPHKIDSKQFKSNIAEFDEMGLDENDPDDINFFKPYHRQNYVFAGQSLINNVMATNRFDQETVRKLVIDILAIRHICLQTYVDKTTGEIKYEYIYPDTAWGIFGDSYDGHDDIAKGWQDDRSVSNFLQKAGNDFDFNKDWIKLIAAINYSNQTKFTGFQRGSRFYNCFENPLCLPEVGITNSDPVNYLPWDSCFKMKISVGYVEWKTWEATSTNLMRTKDNSFVDVVPYSEEIKDKKEVTEYYKESRYQEQVYASYFLATSENTQMIYNFSKAYYQQFTGANDEYASGTLVFYREPGNTAVDMVKTDINILKSAFYKMWYLIDKAKPEDDVYILEELIQQAKILKKSMADAKTPGVDASINGIIEDLIQNQQGRAVRIRSYPQIDGRTVAQLPPLEGKRNGIDSLAISMQAIVEWAEARLVRKILGNGMRLGMNPPSRESNKSEQNTVDASQNATGYIYRMIQYTKERIATNTLGFAQDIIKFKDSLPYKYIQKMLGNDTFESLKLLDDFAAHRYGIFITDYNSDLAKANLVQAAFDDMKNNKLGYEQYFMVTQTQDYKEGSKKLSVYRYKNEKKIRKQQIEDIQMQQQAQMAVQQAAMQVAEFERGTIMMKADLEAKALIAGKQIEAQSKAQVKGMSIQSEPSKIAAQTQGKQDVEVTKATLERSQPFET